MTVALEGAPYGLGVDEAKASCTFSPVCTLAEVMTVIELDLAVSGIDPE